jgi:hypothetical protein
MRSSFGDVTGPGVSVMRSMSYRVSIRKLALRPTRDLMPRAIWRRTGSPYNRVTHHGAPVETHHPKRVDVSEPRDQWATAGRVVEGNAGHEHTIEEALQDRRHVKPPLRKDENELLGQPEPGDITGDGLAIIGRREIAATLGAGEARVKVVSIEINMSTSMPRRSSIARIRSAAALAKALSSGWATTRSARKEGLFRFSRACRHEHKGGFYCGAILRPTSIR